MPTNRLDEHPAGDNPLGTYLRDRRGRLDPAAFGFSARQRRTAGLRREEVAQRANISVTWYTWLEQGRGGAPSADVLDRIARALALSPVEREHMFLLAQHRPPEIRHRSAGGVTPRLQRLLDSMAYSPALVKSASWDVLAWNQAAVAVLADYGAIPPERRNILRLMFEESAVRQRMGADWEHNVRNAVAAFRRETVRAGVNGAATALIDDLSRIPEFAAMWAANDVGEFGEGTKTLDHPVVGRIALEYSAFSVDGQPDLGMWIFSPVGPVDAERVRALVEGHQEAVAGPR